MYVFVLNLMAVVGAIECIGWAFDGRPLATLDLLAWIGRYVYGFFTK